MKIGISCRYEHASKPLRSLVYGEKLLEILKTITPTSTAVRTGDGSAEHPYEAASIGEWFWLAKQETGFAPMYINVGGRLIARWGSGAGPLQDYITDITDYQTVVTMRVPLLTELYGDYEREVRRVKTLYDETDSQEGIDLDLP